MTTGGTSYVSSPEDQNVLLGDRSRIFFRGDRAIKVISPLSIEDVGSVLETWRIRELPRDRSAVVVVESVVQRDGSLELHLPRQEGVTLEELRLFGWANGTISREIALGVAAELLETLETLSNGADRWVHGALRPEHVFIDRDGRAKIHDPLLFQALGPPVGDAQRAIQYRSPTGSALDRADQFAVGAMLFNLLTGGPLYTGRTLEELAAHADGGFFSVSVQNAALGSGEKQLVLNLLDTTGASPGSYAGLIDRESRSAWRRVAGEWVAAIVAARTSPDDAGDVDELIWDRVDDEADESELDVTPVFPISERPATAELDESTPVSGIRRFQLARHEVETTNPLSRPALPRRTWVVLLALLGLLAIGAWILSAG